MMQALMLQPVSMLLYASPLYAYASGIFDGDCEGIVNHAVLMAGYGVDDGRPYFLVKNSWGTDWGEAGYIRLARGIAGMGQCSCLTRGTFPVVEPAAATGPTIIPGPAIPSPPGPLPAGSYYGSPPCSKESELEIRYPKGSEVFPSGAAVCATPLNWGNLSHLCPMPAVGNNETTWWFNANADIYCLQSCLLDEHCPDGAACYTPPPDGLSTTFCVWPEVTLI